MVDGYQRLRAMFSYIAQGTYFLHSAHFLSHEDVGSRILRNFSICLPKYMTLCVRIPQLTPLRFSYIVLNVEHIFGFSSSRDNGHVVT
jgi:hypothetical protein